jgi:hypothetical protein
MPNENGVNLAEMEMMRSLLAFKRQHGRDAYLALLAKFNVQRWNDIPATAHGEVTMQCKAGVAGLNVKHVDNVEDDTPSIQDRLQEIAAKAYGTSESNEDFKTVVASGKTLQEGLNRAAIAPKNR